MNEAHNNATDPHLYDKILTISHQSDNKIILVSHDEQILTFVLL